jgi:hypothetical protein
MSEFACPSCERNFDSQRGLRVHHTRTHDERLPRWVCARCTERFSAEHERKYCSVSCRNAVQESRSNETATAECRFCSETFTYYPSEKEGLYCPSCVRNRSWRDPPTLTGVANPRWDGGKRTVQCGVCETEIERYPNQLEDSNTALCSESCRRQWLSVASRAVGNGSLSRFAARTIRTGEAGQYSDTVPGGLLYAERRGNGTTTDAFVVVTALRRSVGTPMYITDFRFAGSRRTTSTKQATRTF